MIDERRPWPPHHARPNDRPLDRCAAIKKSIPPFSRLRSTRALLDRYPEVGPTAVIVGDGHDPRFQGYAESLADEIWRTRDFRTVTYFTVAEALARASPSRKSASRSALGQPRQSGGGDLASPLGLCAA